jgi:hypothetical protein
MAELADAADSKSAEGNLVGVRPPLPAPRFEKIYKQNGLSMARGYFAWWLFWWLLVFYFFAVLELFDGKVVAAFWRRRRSIDPALKVVVDFSARACALPLLACRQGKTFRVAERIGEVLKGLQQTVDPKQGRIDGDACGHLAILGILDGARTGADSLCRLRDGGL